MQMFVILISKTLYFIGKIFKRGSSLPGQIALKLDKNILFKLKLPKNIIMVTGSNGKTSTTEIIAKLFEDNGYKVGTNNEGSNQIEGVTTMILNNCNLLGKCKKDVLVIESDERYTRITTKYIKPKYLIVTNIYRDQMTRNGHPEHIYDIIKEAIEDDTYLILNADDPLSSMYGLGRENVTYVGINENSLCKKENASAYNDAVYCPNCKKKLKYNYYLFNHIGKYECPFCGFKRNNPDFAITSLDLDTGEFSINENFKLVMSLRSIYNAYNLLFAYAIASIEGLDQEKIFNTLNDYTIQNDRIQIHEIDGMPTMLLTSKHENSISYNQSIAYIINQNKPCNVVIIVDAVSRKYFTSETAWLWDIDFELLDAKCVKKIILAGKYAYDLSIRFSYTGISKNKIIKTPDLDNMISEIKKNKENYTYVLTCFSDRMKFLNRR